LRKGGPLEGETELYSPTWEWFFLIAIEPSMFAFKKCKRDSIKGKNWPGPWEALLKLAGGAQIRSWFRNLKVKMRWNVQQGSTDPLIGEQQRKGSILLGAT